MSSTLFQNIMVLRANGSAGRRTVGVRDGRFAFIGEAAPLGEWDEVIDGTGRMMLPGLVNAHTHVPMTLMRGYGDDMPLQSWLYDRIFPFEDKLAGEDVYWGSLLGMAEMLASGTTSFSDMYYFCDRVADAALECGIKANIGRGISCFDPHRRFADLPARQELVSLYETYHGAGEGRVQIDVAPHSEYTTRPDILADAAEFAAAHGGRIQVHVSETAAEQKDCVERHGKTPAALLRDTGVLSLPVTAAHGVWLTDGDMEIFADCGVTVAHCPRSNLKLGSGVAQVEKLRRRGVKVALGTDSAASNNTLDMLEEMRAAALLAKGIDRNPLAMPAGEALFLATRAGALAQGREDCGDIAEGFCADYVVVKSARPALTPLHSALSNAVYAASPADVEITAVNGRILYRNGAYTTLDIERVLFETQRCVDALLAR